MTVHVFLSAKRNPGRAADSLKFYHSVVDNGRLLAFTFLPVAHDGFNELFQTISVTVSQRCSISRALIYIHFSGSL